MCAESYVDVALCTHSVPITQIFVLFVCTMVVKKKTVTVNWSIASNCDSLNLKPHCTVLLQCHCHNVWQTDIKLIPATITVILQGLDAERDVLRESQRLASERDRELETLRQQVR